MLLTAAGVYLLLSGIAFVVPLLRDGGYEYAFLLALVGPVVAALTTAHLWGSGRDPGAPGVLDPSGTARTAIRVATAALAVPVAYLLGASIAGRTCSVADGLLWLLLLPLPGVWFATALTIFCRVLFRKARLMVLAFAVVSVGYSLLLGYATPALYSYNFFYGYFPGFTYDELLEISTPLILFRILTVLLAAALLLAALLLAGHSRHTLGTLDRLRRLGRLLLERNRLPVTAGVLLLWAGATAFRHDLGFESSAGIIAGRLGDTTETTHFIIHHPPGLRTGGEIVRIAADHELYYRETTADIPDRNGGKIVSFIHPSAAVRHALIGSRLTNIAKPWRRELHTTVQSVEDVLEHELVHVLAGGYGMPLLGISPAMGLTEGLAVAHERTWGTRSLHRTAAALRRLGPVPDIREILTVAGFASSSSSVSYLFAGSFTSWLESTFGMERVLQVYGTTDYPAAFGLSLDSLVLQWNTFLDLQQVTGADSAMVRALFGRRAIFRMHCPRLTARGNRAAAELYRTGAYEGAAEAYDHVSRESGSAEALGGFLSAAFRAGRYGTIAAFHDSLTTVEVDAHLTLALVMGDALWAEGRSADAAALYARLRSADILRRHSEAAAVRLYALRDRRLTVPILGYITGYRSDSASLPLLDALAEDLRDDPLPLYLAGRHLLRLRRYREAHEAFAWAGEVVKDSLLEYERLMGGGESLLALGRREEAAEAFRRAFLYAQNDGHRRETYLWNRRCEAPLP
jgi:hypothetical protein